MRHGGWRNESCAKGYIEDSLAYKAKTGRMIQNAIVGECEQLRNGANLSVSEPATVRDNGESLFDPSYKESELMDVVDQASQSLVHEDYRFDTNIGDSTLIEVVDRASQSLLVDDDRFDAGIDENALIDIVERASQSFNQAGIKRRERDDNGATGDAKRQKNELIPSATGTAANQSINNNSTLRAILSSSFKSVNFQKLENCTFNFYLQK